MFVTLWKINYFQLLYKIYILYVITYGKRREGIIPEVSKIFGGKNSWREKFRIPIYVIA